MEFKVCTKCKENKRLDEFGKRGGDRGDQLRSNCKACKSEKAKTYYKANWTDRKNYTKNYVKDNKDKVAAGRRAYRKANITSIRAYQNAYQKERKDNDPIYKLACNLKSRISNLLKSNKIPKKCRTIDILGCGFKELHASLITTAIINYGFWADFQSYEIDHIIPLATANTEDDVIRLNHYTNLQFLYPEDNGAKLDNLDWMSPYMIYISQK